MKKMNKTYIYFFVVVTLSILTSICIWYLDKHFAFPLTFPATRAYLGLLAICFTFYLNMCVKEK